MRAALLTAYGQDFELVDVADPVITHPEEVIVQVDASGLCRTDLHLWQGEFAEMHTRQGIGLPMLCGHESAGRIASMGSGVTQFALGERVLLHPLATCGHCLACRTGDDMHCRERVRFPGVGSPGGFADFVKTRARALVPIPDSMSVLEAAPLTDAGLTAYHAVKKALPVAVPGTFTVVIGAGGLGHIGIQALRALSQTEIIVVDRKPLVLEQATKWGADQVILADEDGTYLSAVLDATSGAGANVVIDFVGEGGAENDAVELLGSHGLDIIVGSGGWLRAEIRRQVLPREATFAGSNVGSYTDLVELVALVRRKAVIVETTTFPLEDINRALHALQAGQIVGRGVLLPRPSGADTIS